MPRFGLGSRHAERTKRGSGRKTMHSELASIVILFGAALAAAWALRVIRAPALLGFLLAGMAVGPFGLGLIPEHKIHFFAELGLVMLLFTVGLELSPAPLLRMGPRVLVAAGLQIGLTAGLTALLVPLVFPLSGSGAVIIGIAVALSSTAIVLKTLSDRAEADTPAGTLVTGILLIQDLAVILVLILLPLLTPAAEGGGAPSGASGATWWHMLGRAALAFGGLAAATLIGHFILPPLTARVFRHGGRELMTLFAVFMACTGAYLADLANWSWALGACIAGLLLAQTDLRHQLCAEITPFRDVFNALFFMSIGMLVNWTAIWPHAGAIVGLIFATLVVKTLLTFTSVRLAGWPLRLAIAAGLSLSTISEFGYVLVGEATKHDLFAAEMTAAFVAWTVGTMILGALLVPTAGPLSAAIVRRLRSDRRIAVSPQAGTEPGHVIVVGYGVNGENLANVLRATGIGYSVVELNRGNAERARQKGGRVIVGDATRMSILARAGLARARAVVVSIAENQATRRIVAQARAARRDLYILARTRFVSELDELYRLGADRVIPEEFETSIEIFAHVLKEFAVPDNVVDQQIKLVRAGRYGMLRGRQADRTLRKEWMQVLEAAVTQTFLLEGESPACGRTIRELDLRARTGLTIVAVTRAGRPTTNPSPDFRLEAGDVLVLVGTHQQLDEGRAFLSPGAASSPSGG
jgi:CPA2 family monovalent cation:H+ antiporter-2